MKPFVESPGAKHSYLNVACQTEHLSTKIGHASQSPVLNSDCCSPIE